MLKSIKQLVRSAKRHFTPKHTKLIIPKFQIQMLPDTYEKYLALRKPDTIRKRGTFSMTPSLEVFLDYKASVESIDDSLNEYLEEFAGVKELLEEPEPVPFTLAEFFEYHEGNLENLLAPFIEEDEDKVFGAFTILAEL